MSDVTVLGVDPDPRSLRNLQDAVSRSGHVFQGAADARDALRLAVERKPDAVVTRPGLPEMPGRELISRLRDAAPGAPIVLAAKRGQEPEAVAALEEGATAVVFDPLDASALLVHVGALVRWSKEPRGGVVLESGPVSVDLERGELVRPDRRPLTGLELEILRLLLSPPGRCVTRRQIPAAGERAADVHVAALRAKLGGAGRWIETVRGVGYRFRVLEEKSTPSLDNPEM